MAHPDHVTIPNMGEGIHEATLVKWLKAVGDVVVEGEGLVEISTDKVDTELAAPRGGFLVALFKERGTVSVGEVIAQISLERNAEISKPSVESSRGQQKREGSLRGGNGPSADRSQVTLASRSASKGNGEGRLRGGDGPSKIQSYAGELRSSPLVKRRARDLGVNLAQVPASGLGGRITNEDLDAYLAEYSTTNTPEPTRLKTELRDGAEFLEGVAVRREPMSVIRRLTAEHMVRSVRTSPHVTTTFEISVDRMIALKKEHGVQFEQKYQTKLTFTPFFLYAAVCALKEHPTVNASIDGDDILFKSEINLGCAVAIDSGLIVPVIRGAESKSFADLAKSLSDLVHRAHNKKLLPSDVQGGTFSVTNPGMFGSLHSQPIINQPQVAILSVGAITERAIFANDKVKNGAFCQVGLTFDHRIIDGKAGALFLATVRDVLLGLNTYIL